MSKPKIILIGGGGHCRACMDVIQQERRFAIAGVIDRVSSLKEETILDYPYLGDDNDLPELQKKYQYAFVTIGQIKSGGTRHSLYLRLKALGFILPVIVSPFAYVSTYAHIEEGTIVMHHAIVNACAQIGVNCILNTRSLIEHDAIVGDHSHISTSATVNGAARIGNHCFIGSNSTVVNDVQLPDGYFFKAASLIRSLNDGYQIRKDC